MMTSKSEIVNRMKQQYDSVSDFEACSRKKEEDPKKLKMPNRIACCMVN